MSAVVKLRGLPWSATSQDIISFFDPVPMGEESITFISGKDGRASGEAFVWLHESNLDQAMSYNKCNLGNRYIEVFESTFEEYTAVMREMDGNVTQEPSHHTSKTQKRTSGNDDSVTEPVLRVRGLPYSCTAAELADNLSQFGVAESDVSICITTSGPKIGAPSGEAFIRFDCIETATKVFKTQQNASIGTRYMEFFASSEIEIEKRAGHGGVHGYEANRGIDDNLPENRANSGWLRLRGLPYSATVQDVVDFVGQEQHVEESDVTIKIGSDNRPTGEAYVQLDSEDTAEHLMSRLDRKNIGTRFIEVFISSYDECSAVRHNRQGPYSKGREYGSSSYEKGSGKGYVRSNPYHSYDSNRGYQKYVANSGKGRSKGY